MTTMKQDKLTRRKILRQAGQSIKYLKFHISERDKIVEFLRLNMEKKDYYKRYEKIKREIEEYENKSSEEKKTYMESYHDTLYYIIIASTTLSELIDILLMKQIATIESPSLNKTLEDEDNFSSVRRLQLLRVATIISEKDYKNMHILYRIRNKFAHLYPRRLNMQKTFDMLSEIETEDERINKMPNGIDKYYNTALYQAGKMVDILKKTPYKQD